MTENSPLTTITCISKLVGMSRASPGLFRDLGFCGLGGVSGRVDVAVAGAVDEVISGHDRDETLGVAEVTLVGSHDHRGSARWVGWQIN
jgi:hypothetical protein